MAWQFLAEGITTRPLSNFLRVGRERNTQQSWPNFAPRVEGALSGELGAIEPNWMVEWSEGSPLSIEEWKKMAEPLSAWYHSSLLIFLRSRDMVVKREGRLLYLVFIRRFLIYLGKLATEHESSLYLKSVVSNHERRQKLSWFNCKQLVLYCYLTRQIFTNKLRKRIENLEDQRTFFFISTYYGLIIRLLLYRLIDL